MSINRCERCPHITCESDIDGRVVMLPEMEQVVFPFSIEQCPIREGATVEGEVRFMHLLYKPHLVEKL